MADAAAAIEAALCELLGEHGLEGPAAASFASELIIEYPLVRRRGVRTSVNRLMRGGLPRERAQEAALDLLAFELLGRVPYERVLEMVSECSGGRDPLGHCLRAAQVRRRITGQVRIHEPRPLGARVVQFALSWLGER